MSFLQKNKYISSVLKEISGIVNQYKPDSYPIAYKLAFVFTLFVCGSMIVLGLLITQEQKRILEQQMSEFGNTIALQMAESAKEPLLTNDNLTLEMIASNLINHEHIQGVAIYSDERRLIVKAGAIPDISLTPEDDRKFDVVEWYKSEGEEGETALASFSSPVVFRDVVLGYTLITFDRTLVELAQQKTIRTVISATVLLVLFGIVASILLGKRLARPIHQLLVASKSISEGNYKFRFEGQRKDEIGDLMVSLNTMAHGLLRKDQVEKTFSRYVSPKVAKEVLSNIEKMQLGGRYVDASVLFADIVGFTTISENMSPEDLSGLLNEYFSYISQAAHVYNGYVDKYIGDCAMIVFGVPEEDKNHAYNSVACAVLIQQLIQYLNAQRTKKGLYTVQFSIGINCGKMLAGNMGSADRMDYTVVGDTVNLASRLASVAGPSEIIISEKMLKDLELNKHIVSEQRYAVRLPGIKNLVTTYHVMDVIGRYREIMEKKFSQILHHLGENA